MTRYVATLVCPDQPGIVLAAAQGIVAIAGNILENDQFSDPATGLFCMRTVFESPETDDDLIRASIAGRVTDFDGVLHLRPESRRRRALIMVSKLDHCLVDLLYRRQIGELALDVPLVVSNHADCAPVAASSGIPFMVLPVNPQTKQAAESRLLELVDEHRVDLVVLARYMQVLSGDLCRRLPGQIINIHHSFLPGFKGARPYHQAYQHGVKLIGATAHYVTANLDEGPIIDQDVVRVSHSCRPEDLVALGRDVERAVLARAIRLHIEDRVTVAGGRTVVFER
ncbi:MAG: formyltetrahydrofolate deformylase [Acidimicrobiales bacterium]